MEILDVWIFSPTGWVSCVMYTPVCLSGASRLSLVWSTLSDTEHMVIIKHYSHLVMLASSLAWSVVWPPVATCYICRLFIATNWNFDSCSYTWLCFIVINNSTSDLYAKHSHCKSLATWPVTIRIFYPSAWRIKGKQGL